ncbi:MAG: methionine adenosyltransferase [Acidilobaceae archaeon]|nr:methionine adenosyltransferase [Acidilobaceae archaeon]
MRNIVVEESRVLDVEELDVEMVERKGLGHPDYICDAVAEAVSVGLSRYYEEKFGRILHHNVDKVLLVGGQSNPRFGGGEVLQPIYILVSGRLTTEVRTSSGVEPVPFGSIILDSARRWLRENFRFLNPDLHVVVDYKVGRGSTDLRALVEAETKVPLSNDTSMGISYAPLSTLERLVLETERMLNSKEFKARYPMVGEDVKVMGLRNGNRISLTVAAAMISSLIKDAGEYWAIKEEVAEEVRKLAGRIAGDREVEVFVNTGDIKEKDIVYLTVTGTSSEHGDDGATGRGNRVNGLITPFRPMSMEATAGKNPVSHVGKVYNVVAGAIARRIYEALRDRGVATAYVSLLSQIGKPIDMPHMANIKLKMAKGAVLSLDVRREAERIADEELSSITKYTEKIVRGEANLF